MEVGQVVDFIEEYNRMHEQNASEEASQEPVERDATQADWDAFWG